MTSEYYRLLAGYDAGMLPASVTTSLDDIFLNDPPDANERIERIAARHFAALDSAVSAGDDDDERVTDWGRHKAELSALRDEFNQDDPDYKYVWVEGIDFGALDCGGIEPSTKGALTLKIMSWNGGGGSPWHVDANGRVSLRVSRLRRNDPDIDALWGDELDEMVSYEAKRHNESVSDYIFGSDEILPIEAAYRRANARKAARTRAARKPAKAAVDPTEDITPALPAPTPEPLPAPAPRPAPRPARRRPIGNGCRPCAVVIRTHSAPTAWCARVAPGWFYGAGTVREVADRAERERMQARIDRLEAERKEDAKQRELAARERMQLAERPRRGAVAWIVRKIQAVPLCDWWVYGPLIWLVWWVIQVNIEARL